MTRSSSNLDKILENVYTISKEDKELLAEACINRYNEIVKEIHELKNKIDLYNSFVIGFPFGIIATGGLIAALSIFSYLRGDIQYAIDLIKAYALSAPIYIPIPFIFYRLIERVEEKVDKKESEALLYKLCHELYKK